MVGNGFLVAYEALRGGILRAVQALGQYSHHIIMTGHSLGASLSNLAAVDLSLIFVNGVLLSIFSALRTLLATNVY